MKTDILVLVNTEELLKVITGSLLKQFNISDNIQIKEFLNDFTPDLIASQIRLTDFLNKLTDEKQKAKRTT